jgi:uncharacterized lipoprotein YddW (UPF0748 family)
LCIKKVLNSSFFILLIGAIISTAITLLPQIDRETRAVWVSTNFRLDWPPPTFDQEKQKLALVNIFDNIKSKNLNTVFFQARSNGTVLFNSSFEPMSPHLTGRVGGIPNYDPLKFAIEQAHGHGLEIHAWINVVRCFSGTETATFQDPNHIAQRKPEWVVEVTRDSVKSFWLDPGLPEVREYLSELILELAKNYDVDGIHLDFIRYPGREFDDEFSFSIYGNGLNRDDWRRKNITSLVESIYKKIKAHNKYIKLGAAPIGVYKNLSGMYGWESYNEIYQDSREWLKRGILDYVAPQIYWSLDENTRFDLLAKDWKENSFGRSIILGIGAYKDNVKSQMEDMIDYSRKINTDGIAFFRYSNIKDYQFTNFEHKTLPSLMKWMDGINPKPPKKLIASISDESKNQIIFKWDIDKINSDDSLRYFALYNLPHPAAELLPDYLIDIISSESLSHTINLDQPKKINYYFALKSVSKLWNESIDNSNIASVQFNRLRELSKFNAENSKPILISKNDNAIILLNSQFADDVKIFGISKNSKKILARRDVNVGKNILYIGNIEKEISRLTINFNLTRKEFELIINRN